MRDICGEFFIFEQGNGPAREERETIFRNETRAFILPDLLPPSNTDLNPVEYKNVRRNAAAGLASS